MDDLQRIYAENLINQVLFKGQLKKLNENSVIGETPPSCTHTASPYASSSNATDGSQYYEFVNLN